MTWQALLWIYRVFKTYDPERYLYFMMLKLRLKEANWHSQDCTSHMGYIWDMHWASLYLFNKYLLDLELCTFLNIRISKRG